MSLEARDRKGGCKGLHAKEWGAAWVAGWLRHIKASDRDGLAEGSEVFGTNLCHAGLRTFLFTYSKGIQQDVLEEVHS